MIKNVLVVLLLIAPACLAAKVVINADNVLKIDGKPTLVIGFIMPPPPDGQTPWGKNGIEELHDAGATFLRTGLMGPKMHWEDEATWQREQQWHDAAAKYGMHCLIGLRDAGSLDKADREAMLRKIVTRFKDHPGMGAYYGVDEPQWVNHPIEPMTKAYKLIKEVDPDHPVWVNHAPRGEVEDLLPYNVTCDALGMDVYPISYPPGTHSLAANKEISMVGDFTNLTMRVAEGKKPVWMCLQIAWSGVTKPGKTLRFPTLPQQRYMTYQALIHGARGLIYFGGQLPTTLNERDAKLGWNWTYWQRVLRPVMEEIGEKSPLYPALVAPDSKLPVRCEGSTGMELKVREAGDEIFIMACKREGDTVRVEFNNLPAVEPVGEVMFEPGRKVTVENFTSTQVEKGVKKEVPNRRFTDWFAPFDVHVYRLKKLPGATTVPVDNKPPLEQP